MLIYLKRLLSYIFAAWIVVGVTFIYPQTMQPTEGFEITGRGLPLPFYASAESVFGPVESQVSVGVLLLDFAVWLVLIFVLHFLYSNLIKK